MGVSEAIDLGREALLLILIISAPILVAGFAVALIVSLLQALTQVQDQTLSIVPKMIAMLIVAILAGPWILSRLMEFSEEMFTSLP